MFRLSAALDLCRKPCYNPFYNSGRRKLRVLEQLNKIKILFSLGELKTNQS